MYRTCLLPPATPSTVPTGTPSAPITFMPAKTLGIVIAQARARPTASVCGSGAFRTVVTSRTAIALAQ